MFVVNTVDRIAIKNISYNEIYAIRRFIIYKFITYIYKCLPLKTTVNQFEKRERKKKKYPKISNIQFYSQLLHFRPNLSR